MEPDKISSIPDNLILIMQESELKLPKKYSDVRWLLPALEGSFVVVSRPNLLARVDAKGKVLLEKEFDIEVESTGMLSPSVVAVASPRVLLLFDVEAGKERRLITNAFSLHFLSIFDKMLLCIIDNNEK